MSASFVQDFSKFYVTSGIVNDLVLSLYFVGDDGGITWEYWDYFSKEKQDFYYVQAVWTHLLQETDRLNSRYSFVRIWSDGAAQHFKQYKTLYWFSTLKNVCSKEFEYHFFAPGHGHSLCDSHTGIGKQCISREERELNHQLLTAEDIQDVYSNSLSNTTTIQLGSEKAKQSLHVKGFKGIKAYHHFRFVQPGVLACRKLSNRDPTEVREIEGHVLASAEENFDEE